VEPLYWVAAAPLWWGLRRAASRLLFALAVAGVVVLGLAIGMMSGLSCCALAVGFLLLAAGGSKLSPRSAARVSVVLGLAVTCAFALAGREAAQRAQGLARANFPDDRLLDRVLTPQPADPLCWDLWLLEASGDRYVARHAVLSLGPPFLPAGGCALAEPVPHTAPRVAVAARDTPAVRWLGETFVSDSLLKGVVAANCKAAAFMLFARAPFIAVDAEVLCLVICASIAAASAAASRFLSPATGIQTMPANPSPVGARHRGSRRAPIYSGRPASSQPTPAATHPWLAAELAFCICALCDNIIGLRGRRCDARLAANLGRTRTTGRPRPDEPRRRG
jgi:hypothetical protein